MLQLEKAVPACAILFAQEQVRIIAPGCEIPKDTPVENVIAMQEAIEEN